MSLYLEAVLFAVFEVSEELMRPVLFEIYRYLRPAIMLIV
jgi:hypothetical protein